MTCTADWPGGATPIMPMMLSGMARSDDGRVAQHHAGAVLESVTDLRPPARPLRFVLRAVPIEHLRLSCGVGDVCAGRSQLWRFAECFGRALPDAEFADPHARLCEPQRDGSGAPSLRA